MMGLFKRKKATEPEVEPEAVPEAEPTVTEDISADVSADVPEAVPQDALATAPEVAPEAVAVSPDAMPALDTHQPWSPEGELVMQTPQADATELEAIANAGTMNDQVAAALKKVYDPEIPVNIYELGLVYEIDVSDDKDVAIQMTLTSPGCPVAEQMPGMVEHAVHTFVKGVRDVEVEIVWDPPWSPDRMSEAAQLELGFI